uniref:Rad51-like C-terminal domain-containing protein n=1 Tax=Cyprinodon variegatus TaxID=28743 RepID=A0A3Q2FD56_CYPVA
MFLDTEGSFQLQRVVDLAGAAVRHCSLLAEDEEQRVAMTTFSVETILSNIFLVLKSNSVGLGLQLVSMATSQNIAVVITNHMTTRLRGSQSQLVPALGDIWGHAPSIRLLLQWEGPRRLASILKSPAHIEATVQYQITCEGFRDPKDFYQKHN